MENGKSALKSRKDAFDLMLERVKMLAKDHGAEGEYKAFVRWFVDLFYSGAHDLVVSDGAGDGKIDAFCHTNEEGRASYHIINSKYTRGYNQPAPVQFYEELTALLKPFLSMIDRNNYLSTVRPELRTHYEGLLKAYDEGYADLTFITNHRRNETRSQLLAKSPIKLFHLEDLVQFIIDDIDGAMPRTPDLTLSNIHAVLNADREDSPVATSIVFARAIDFIRYMKCDPHDLLFARNVRVFIGSGKKKKEQINAQICQTFEGSPSEFAFSNNGITILCEKHRYDPGDKELTLLNPRVVNGSQTLHTIRYATKQSDKARVMVRVIEIPAPSNVSEAEDRREIIDKIAVRSNQQNPIKRYNLVSNDEYQMELFRYFRRKNLFYERRVGEWKHRKTDLRNIGFSLGPGIKELAQMVASLNTDAKGLGPAAAQGGVTRLFEEPAYPSLCEVSPVKAYQYYLTTLNIEDSVWRMGTVNPRAQQVLTYGFWTILALVGKTLQKGGFVWGSERISVLLERQDDDWENKWSKKWLALVKSIFNDVRVAYRTAQIAARKMGDDLTAANFFKSETQVNRILGKKIADRQLELGLQALGKRERHRNGTAGSRDNNSLG